MSKPLSPSAAARWGACPASHYVAQKYPPLPSTSAADEGTLAHTFAAWALYQALSASYPDAVVLGDVPPEPEEALATVEMLDGAQTYADAVVSKLSGHGGLSSYGIEYPVEGFAGRVRGRVDFIGYAEDKSAFIADYKFGGEPVFAIDNLQLAHYASCVHFETARVFAGIIQPRSAASDFSIDAASWWELDNLRELGDRLEPAVKAASEADENTMRTPGSHCRWCPARSVCLAAVAEPLLLACTAAGQAEAAKDATDAQIGRWLTAVKAVDKVADDLARIAKARIGAGAEIPGWRLSWRKKQDWALESEGVEAQALELSMRLGVPVDDVIKKSLRSPSELKKSLPAEKIAEVTRETSSSALIGAKT